MSKGSIVLASGGTGGHVFPAQAVGEELLKRGYKVYILTDDRGQTYRWNEEFHIITIPSSEISALPLALTKGGILLFKGIIKAKRDLRAIQPKVVLGFGGYPSIATMLAAILSRYPTAVHQADAILGQANRLVVPYVKAIATSFPHTKRIKEAYQKRVEFTGLPLRQTIQYAPYEEPKDKLNILITGGSQGAQFFGELLPEAVKLLEPEQQSRLAIAHQCRPECIEDVRANYAGTQAQVELESFFQDMGTRLKKAHFVISRAGASSVLEAASVGRPALFVPYPYATDDHQTFNAQEAVSVGGAWCVQQKDLNPEHLAKMLREFMKSPWKLTEAAAKIRQITVPNAVNKLADLVEKVKANKHGRKAAA